MLLSLDKTYRLYMHSKHRTVGSDLLSSFIFDVFDVAHQGSN